MKKVWGGALVEVLIAVGIFFALTVILLAGWSQGLKAWRTVSDRNEVLGQAQRFLRQTERELEASSVSGLEIQDDPATILAFVSAYATSEPQDFKVVATTGALNWQKQVVIYHEASRNTIMRRQIAIPSSSAAYRKATPISSIDLLGFGEKPIAFYATSGQVAARQVASVAFAVKGRRLTMRLELLTDLGRQASFESVTLLRN